MTFALGLLGVGAGLVSIGFGIGWAAARYGIGKRKALVRGNGALWATAPVHDLTSEDFARMSFEDGCG